MRTRAAGADTSVRAPGNGPGSHRWANTLTDHEIGAACRFQWNPSCITPPALQRQGTIQGRAPRWYAGRSGR